MTNKNENGKKEKKLLKSPNKQTAKLIVVVFWSLELCKCRVYAVPLAQLYDAVRNSIDTHSTDGYKIWIPVQCSMCCIYCHINRRCFYTQCRVGNAAESRGWRRVLLCLQRGARWSVFRQCTRTLIEPNYICCEIGKHPQNTKQGLWLWNRNRIMKPLSLSWSLSRSWVLGGY